MAKTREQKIEELRKKAIEKENKDLIKACEKFLNYHELYRNGQTDVIVGLRYLDILEEDIERVK
jgi:hypothetical protein